LAKRIACILINRSNYARLKPVLEILRDNPKVDLKLICSGTMPHHQYGKAIEEVQADGFTVQEVIYNELLGSNLNTMAKSIGVGLIDYATAFDRLKPDFVLLIGDRYEALGVAVAATVQNICLIHVQGGEVTGTIDESIRHSITKMAHYHFPATEKARERILAMGEDPKTVFMYGCPFVDVIARADKKLPSYLNELGVGKRIDFTRPYILCVFHPVTTEYGTAEANMSEVLQALHRLNEQVVMLWPNIDADSNGITRAIRKFMQEKPDFGLRVYKHLEVDTYIALMDKAAILVGNSSSFVRDAGPLGTPVVLVGDRQNGREWGDHVIRTDLINIRDVLEYQLFRSYKPMSVYGRPGAARKIANQIMQLKPYSQKRFYDRTI
jgi:UDP-hydrolysing UDP-N-acetyl-D-glucosamine 2-epimerase